jgi:KipI family sensor histidine kinase inhibitor
MSIVTLERARVTPCGGSALLLEAEGELALPTQMGIWNIAEEIRDWPGVLDLQPGMNNLLVVLDPLEGDADAIAARILARWQDIPRSRALGRLIEVDVVYGGEGGMDLQELCGIVKLTPREVVERHAAPEYVIFAPGVSPGFGYLYGLDQRLFCPRRQVPVMRPAGGGVAIGGAQSNLGAPIRPGAATMNPTGWYVIGRATNPPVPFDLDFDPPNRVSLGDRIRFRIERLDA